MENIWDEKWDTSTPTTSNEGFDFSKWNRNDTQGSSGNRLFDIFTGLGSTAMSLNPQNKPNVYYIDSQYKGNGLAYTPLTTKANKNNYTPPLTWGETMRNMYRMLNPLSTQLNGSLGGLLGSNGNYYGSPTYDALSSIVPSSIFSEAFGGNNINSPISSILGSANNYSSGLGNFNTLGTNAVEYLSKSYPDIKFD